MWRPGDRVTHRFNRELGPGRVREAGTRRVVVEFPVAGQTLSFAAASDALAPLVLAAGAAALLADDDGSFAAVAVAELRADGRCRLGDGRVVAADRVWPLAGVAEPLEELCRGEVGSLADLLIRLAALRLRQVREADGLGSFLGGRVRLHPHQLHAAEQACRRDPVRWLLADGVGLGKTVEACLIMNHLIHTGRSERTLVVAPESLTVQWLGELWRKHHQVFTLVDEERLADVTREQGGDDNPFVAHRRAIVALESLIARPWLVERAVAAGVDLVVVDEAHHLERAPGHAGNLAWRAVAPLAATGRHLLLLTATPLEEDAHGFLRLVQLLRPEEMPDDRPLETWLDQAAGLPACTTATRAADIPGWPPRVPAPVELDAAGWAPVAALEAALRAQPVGNELQAARKARLVARALASAPALAAHLSASDAALRELLARYQAADPRVDWLVAQAPRWQRAGSKTLVFVAHLETLELIKEALARRAHLRVGLFHEQLEVKRRDVEVAQLRLPDGPSLMVTTECGGEGRNFEMCDRLVLIDLPWHPGVVEQRIGRLDRIGRGRPTEVVYFRPPSGLGAAVVRLYEELGLFGGSGGGSVGAIDRELKLIARSIARVAAESPPGSDDELLAPVLAAAEAARGRVEAAAYRELHRHRFRQEDAGAILARVPAELEALNRAVVLAAAGAFGFEVEQQPGADAWLIALSGNTLVDRLPGVPPESSFLGTFDREEAVARETLDFFSSGHPLVEGVLAELADGPRGRTACVEVAGPEESLALAAILERERRVAVVDLAGRPRPDLERLLTAPDPPLVGADHRRWTAMPGWAAAIRRAAAHLPIADAAALVVIRVNPDRWRA